MNVRPLVRLGIAAAAFCSSMLLAAGPAHAAPPPWIVAGDQDGALGNCDPAVLAKTSDAGATWISQRVFQVWSQPCAEGGRINAMAHGQNGRWFAAGYYFTPSGLKQGIAFYSDDGDTWSIAYVIPGTGVDTEFVDVEPSASDVVLVADAAQDSVHHALAGPMTGWQGLYSSSGVLRDIDAWQGGPGGYAQSGVGYALGPNGKDCGIYGTYYAWGYFDRAPALDSCVTGYDVHLEALETEMVNGAGGSSYGVAIAVGSARATGQAKRPAVMVFDPSTGTRSTRILPGSGDLRAIAFDQPWGPASGSGSAWVAVGSKPLLGANVATIYRSTDRGQTWTAVTPPSGTKSLNDVAYHDAGFVAVGDGGRILHSTDGATWTVGASPMTAFGIPGSGSVRAIAVDR